MNTTYNFKLEKYDYEFDPKYQGEFKDSRNGFKCTNPTVDLECYKNYIELLNLHRDKWKSFGYLDLGLMPVAMGPSFMQNWLAELMTGILNQLHITPYFLPPVSLMNTQCKMPVNDIWVMKEDVAKLLGVPADKVTTVQFIEFLQKILKQGGN